MLLRYCVKEERNILHKIKRRKGKWIGHILWWNCFLKQFIEGRIKGKKRREGRCKELLDYLKQKW
jgi:hypothetical protein